MHMKLDIVCKDLFHAVNLDILVDHEIEIQMRLDIFVSDDCINSGRILMLCGLVKVLARSLVDHSIFHT